MWNQERTISFPHSSHLHPLLPSPSPVHVAASVGAVECLQVLAAHGADLEQRSMHGAQPLHEAAASGQTG